MGGGDRFLIENPRRGGVSRRGRGGGAGRVGLGNFLGVGAKFYFFRGRNVSELISL